VLELDADSKRLKIPWGEVTEEEAVGMRVLDQERMKREREVAERRAEEDEEKRRVAEMRMRGGW